MFQRYIGAEGGIHFIYQSEDNHSGEKLFYRQSREATTMFAWTIGPRLNIPLQDILGEITFLDHLEMTATAQGGLFTGLSGRLSETGPGFTAGGSLNYLITEELAVGPFVRWSRAYIQPNIRDLGPGQVPAERMAQDIRWVTAGVAVEYRFPQTEAAPTPPAVVAQAPVAPSPPPLPPPAKRKIVLRSVYFEFDKSDIRSESRPVLDEAANTLKHEGDVRIVAEGHTDSAGSDLYNKKLGRHRAEAVRSYLVSRGIAGDRIRVVSFGESRPVASNDTEEGRAQNRRVELQVEGPGR